MLVGGVVIVRVCEISPGIMVSVVAGVPVYHWNVGEIPKLVRFGVSVIEADDGLQIVSWLTFQSTISGAPLSLGTVTTLLLIHRFPSLT